MPTDKDFKRVVRDRMKKTGESYTAARAQLLRNKPKSKHATRAAKALAAAPAVDYAKAENLTHQQIAEYVHTKFDVPDWWTQMVTVGYERIKGLRVRGQRRDGTFEVSKSKVFAVPVDELFSSFSDAKRRARWMSGTKADVRHATPNKSIRMNWPDGSAVDIGFFSKGVSKSQVAIGHRKLASQSHAVEMKTFWSEKLQALAELLGRA